jgi:hypothetical protein
MKLDFDTVEPGQGNLAKRAGMMAFRNKTLAVGNRGHQMQEKSLDEISKEWGGLQITLAWRGCLAKRPKPLCQAALP